jgi:hypothetical protein
VCIGQCASFAAAGPSGVSTVAVVKAATIDTSDVTRGDTIDTNDVDINEMCEAFERTSIARSTTPPGFVRGAEKYVPGTPNFHRDVSLKDAVDLKYRYPFGHRLMAKHGYHDQGGLGLDGSGIQRPIDAHKLANEVRDRESSIGLGYKPKGKGKAPVNGHSTFVTEEPTTGLTGLAVAWKKCVADPHAGDKTAQKGYTINGAKHSAAQATTHGKGAANQANTTTITYKEYIIKDTWKDRAKSNGHSPNEEAQGQTSEVASIMQDSGRAIPKQVTDCTSTTAGTNVKKYLPGRKNWTRASDSRKEAQKEVTQRSMNDLPTPPRGWVWKDGALKPDLDPRRADNPESNLFG